MTSSKKIGHGAIAISAITALVVFLTACSPSPAENKGSQGESPESIDIVSFVWTEDANCGICHEGEQESADSNVCLLNKHLTMDCLDCHSSVALAEIHKGTITADAIPDKLLKSEIPNDICLSCHYDTVASLAEATFGVQVIDNNGTAKNPHSEMLKEQHESIRCFDCHAMHTQETAQQQAKATCTNCHHSGVFECYTCHE